MDLVISRHPRGYRLDNGYGECDERGGDIVAIFPRVGWRARHILRELQVADGWVVSSLPSILAAVVDAGLVTRARSRSPRDRRRCTHCGECEDEPEDYEAICDPCLRRRDAQVPARSAQARR